MVSVSNRYGLEKPNAADRFALEDETPVFQFYQSQVSRRDLPETVLVVKLAPP